MRNYTAIRRVKKVIGTTGEGNPLMGGPFEVKRDMPLVFVFVAAATTAAFGGFILGGVTGLGLGIIVGGAILYAGARVLVHIRRLPEGVTVEDWIGRRVDAAMARPTTISGPNPFADGVTRDAVHKLLATTDVIHGNIHNCGGRYWAEYRLLDPMENGLVTAQQSNAVLQGHKFLFRVFLRHGALIGRFKEPIPARELIEDSFTDGDSDPADIPQYADAVIRTLDSFTDKARDEPDSWPSREVHTIAFYCGKNEGDAARVRDEIMAAVPFTWTLRPATPAEMYWRTIAHCVRGVAYIDGTRTDVPDALPTIEVDDGARTDISLTRRFSMSTPELYPVVKITVGDTVSYQSILTVKMPDEIDFPDSNFLSLFAHLSAPIDIAIRAIPIEREVVLEKNRQADITISDNQRETEHLQSRVAAYSREERLLQRYSEAMAFDPDMSSVQYRIFVAVGGNTPAEVADQVKLVETTFAHAGIHFNEPIPGKQEELWAAMLPGAVLSKSLVNKFDETTIDDFAELLPFTTAAIGHQRGPIIARNLTSGLGDVVRLAADEVVQANRSASIGIVADVGGGKSTLGKVLAYYAHVRGHTWGAVDRSNIDMEENPPRFTGEWVKFAEKLSNTQIVDVISPPGSMDPLKVWAHDLTEAVRRSYGLLVELLRMDEDQELALSEALDVEYMTGRGIVSMATLGTYLLASDDPAAVKVGRKIRQWQRYPFAAAIFDDSLEPLVLTARGTVFRTHSLQLPTAGKVFNKHLYDKLQPEERYAIALYPLMVSFLQAAFMARGGPGWIFIDEAWTVTRTPVGNELMQPVLRDTRKHNIIPVFMTHAGDGDLDDPIYKLITIKFVGRATDSDMALANLGWFRSMPITEDVVDDMQAMKNGRFYMAMMNDDADTIAEGEGGRGVRQVAEIQVERPADPVIRDAMSTKPPRADRTRDRAAA